jgi:hypothetical protein
VLNGIFAPGGMRIGWCAWGLFRNGRVFGGDADVFRAERRLAGDAGAEGDRVREMEDRDGGYVVVGV